MEVGRLLAAVLPLHVLVDHPAPEGARPEQRHDGGQVLEPVGSDLPQEVAHPRRLQLEDAERLAAPEHAERVGVAGRQGVEVGGGAAGPAHVVDRLREDRQRAQPEEVHLEEADLLEDVHRVLRRDVVAHLVERDVLLERGVRDHDAGGVLARVAVEPLQAARDRHQLLEPRVLAHLGLQVVVGLERLLEARVGAVGDLLRQGVHVLQGDVEDPADVADDGAGRHRAERHDLADALASAVLLLDVADDLLAPVLAEVDVDVGHRDALAVQEPLEEQVVRQRVDVRDAQRVRDERARGAPAPGPDRDAALPGPADEVPHDQEVGDEPHLLDDGRLLREAGLDRGLPRAPVAARRALAAEPAEVRDVLLAGRRRELRQVEAAEVELQVAAVRDVEGGARGLLDVAEEVVHRVARPVAEQRLLLQAVAVLQRLAHADAHVHLVGEAVVLGDVVDVVGGHERDPRGPGDGDQALVDLLLPVAAVALELEVVPVPEDVAHLLGRLPRAGRVAVLQVVAGLAREARRLGDDPLGVLRQELLVDAGDVVEALGERPGRQLDEVAVALLVHRQEDEVVRDHRVLRAVEAALGGHVRLEPHDGLDPLRPARLVELDGAAQVAVVGQRERRLLVARRRVDEALDLGGPVEQAVVAVDVGVDEGRGHGDRSGGSGRGLRSPGAGRAGRSWELSRARA